VSTNKDLSCDAVVVGTGLGGSSFAYELSRHGFTVVVVDEGEPIRHTAKDLSPVHVYKFGDKPYIGGLTKFYGASMYRLREIDFRPTVMEAGISPGWPISYGDLEPYYATAERLYKVHGSSENDPTEPPRSTPWPHDPIPHQGSVCELVERLRSRAGVQVSHIPRALDYDPVRGGACVLCQHCDAYFCPRDAKVDAEIGALRPAIGTGLVNVLHATSCQRILTSRNGTRAVGVRVKRGGEEFTIHAPIVAIACGVMGTPVLLWRSRDDHHPNGLANGSGTLGRNFTAHTQGWIFALQRGVQRRPFHQKTFAIHSFYESAPDWPYPTGVIQAAGYIEPLGMSRRYRPFAAALLRNSLQMFIMTEGVPAPDTGFHLSDSGATLMNPPKQNVKTFAHIRRHAKRLLRAAGYPVFAPGAYDTRWHGVGTARMGIDPATSVVDPTCQAHDVDGLYIVDASALTTPGAVNTGLTIAANALRVATHVAGRTRSSARAASSNSPRLQSRSIPLPIAPGR
jgi:choline dehydrogenase-like flavoprotein